MNFFFLLIKKDNKLKLKVGNTEISAKAGSGMATLGMINEDASSETFFDAQHMINSLEVNQQLANESANNYLQSTNQQHHHHHHAEASAPIETSANATATSSSLSSRFSYPFIQPQQQQQQPQQTQPTTKSTAKRILFNLISGTSSLSNNTNNILKNSQQQQQQQGNKGNIKAPMSLHDQKKHPQIQQINQSRRLSDFHRPTKVSLEIFCFCFCLFVFRGF